MTILDALGITFSIINPKCFLVPKSFMYLPHRIPKRSRFSDHIQVVSFYVWFLDNILFHSNSIQGALPIKYLGLPLFPSRLSPSLCTPILDRMQSKLEGWSTKSLSYAGRRELINSTLNSMHIFWTAIFELPASIADQIEKICRRFLWGGSENVKTRNPVAWDQVCQPKEEGGIGLRRVKDWNLASICSLCFQIASNKQSLWVNYVKWKYLKRNSFWKVKTPAKCSWAWRGILKVRDRMKHCVTYSIGNGKNTNIWYDPWLPNGSLVDQFGPNIISQSGLTEDLMVDGLIANGMLGPP